MALRLAAALSKIHRISVDVQPYHLRQGEVLVSIWVGLVVRCDGRRYRWDVPTSKHRRYRGSGWRTTSEKTYGRAAKRLTTHYAMVRNQATANMVPGGSLLSSMLLDELLGDGNHWQVQPLTGDLADSSPATGSP
ncbi:hypothetical protein OG339_45610 [Streptosporangium sp. NBC_01495]|uniref:hypothetical protein n=1 Tax=Streptosporangium sp. NBC_01495 TaxID=2903899 RepID=UPI002E31F070|nr:hypothetical protein [Streptosporangium sp. NBC_01495]